MKVVVAHSAYRSSQPSGENAAVDAEVQLLRRSGAEVHVFIPSSDELVRRGHMGTALGALGAVWNLRARTHVQELVERVKPDVVHVHNLFPRLSAAVFAPIRRQGAALVSTFHNYRLFCATGLAMRQGQPCLECLDAGHPVPALVHGCYRDRRLATMPVATALALQRVTGVWRSLDAAICLTEYQRALLLRTGLLDPLVTHVRANGAVDECGAAPWTARSGGAVFVGRLSQEKGPQVVLEAWRLLGASAPPLLVIGDGPLRAVLERQAGAAPITFLGQLPRAEVAASVAQSRLALVPSLALEGFPLAIREAFAAGVPVVASARGSMAELVRDGRTGAHFAAGSGAALAQVVRRLWADPAGLERMGAAARVEYETHYAPAAALTSLLAIYEAARAHRRASPGGAPVVEA